jgi:cell division septation protein DedD
MPNAPARSAAERRRAAASEGSAARASTEPAGNGYVVQVTATRTRTEADAVAKRLSSKGYPTFVMPVGGAGAGLFRVRVGKYNDRREAESISRRLEKEEQFKPWITR